MSAKSRFRCMALAAATVLVMSLGSPASAATTPAKTAGLRAVPTSSTVKLTWGAAKNAKLYSVCLLTSKAAKRCLKSTSRSARRSVTLKGLKPTGGKDYYFKVYAWNGSAHSTSKKIGFDLKPAPKVVKPAAVTSIEQSVTSDSATISWRPAKNAQTYVVCLFTNASTETCWGTSAKTAARTATFANLEPTAGADYYFRVYAYRGAQRSSSAKLRFDLPVGSISGLDSPVSSADRISLDWDPATNADRYDVQVATNAAMTSGRKTVTAAGTSSTVADLVPGTTYYYRLRGLNGSVSGAFTPVGQVTLPTNSFTAVVLTYNLCGQDKCRTGESAAYLKAVPVWSKRKPLAAKIALNSGADVIATQESTTKDTNFGAQLPGFSLGAYYSAKSLFFKNAKYTKIRSGTITLDLNRGRYAVWVELQDKVTNSNFIVADAHLQPHKGANVDRARLTQSRVLLAEIAKVNTDTLPVVYAGDFNSNRANANQEKYPGGFDAPAKAFTEAGVVDTFNTADARVNATWNSSNHGKNPPSRHSDHLDHIFVDPRIIANAWRVIVSVKSSPADPSKQVYTTPFASDHNAVRATLTIPGRS